MTKEQLLKIGDNFETQLAELNKAIDAATPMLDADRVIVTT